MGWMRSTGRNLLPLGLIFVTFLTLGHLLATTSMHSQVSQPAQPQRLVKGFPDEDDDVDDGSIVKDGEYEDLAARIQKQEAIIENLKDQIRSNDNSNNGDRPKDEPEREPEENSQESKNDDIFGDVDDDVDFEEKQQDPKDSSLVASHRKESPTEANNNGNDGVFEEVADDDDGSSKGFGTPLVSSIYQSSNLKQPALKPLESSQLDLQAKMFHEPKPSDIHGNGQSVQIIHATGTCLEAKVNRPNYHAQVSHKCHTEKISLYQQYKWVGKRFISLDERCLHTYPGHVIQHMESIGVISAPQCDTKDTEWEVIPDPRGRDGWYFLRHGGTGMCLDFELWRKQQLPKVKKCDWTCDQLFSIVPVGEQLPMESMEKVMNSVARPHPPVQGQRLLCWVLTMPRTIEERAQLIARTWGRWCDIFLVFTSGDVIPDDLKQNTISLELSQPESRNAVWEKVRKSWLHIYENYRFKADWFLKADDDAFVSVANLRSFLGEYHHWNPHFFGRPMIHHRKIKNEDDIYNSGGAGYVLSRESLRRIGRDPKLLREDNRGHPEDTEIALRLSKVGVYASRTREESGRERFHALGVFALRVDYNKAKNPKMWYWTSHLDEPQELEDCCSERWITTHYMSPSRLQQAYTAHVLQCEAAGPDHI